MSADFDPVASMSWSPEAEAGLVGAILLNNDLYDLVADIVRADHFHDTDVAKVFTAAEALILAGKAADVVTVFERVKSDIELIFVHQMTEAAGTARSVRRYAELIAEKALGRRLLAASLEVREIAMDMTLPVVDRIGQAQSKIETLQENSVKSAPQAIEQLAVAAMDRINAMSEGAVEAGIPTQIPRLDELLGGGLKPGKQMILAARPSVGKSSLAQQLCINVAKQGYAAAMFSQEMTCQEMTDRAIANLGHLGMDQIQTGRMRDESWTRLADAVERMRGMPLFFDEQPALTLAEIAAKARILKRRNDLKLLVIDYIQLCGTSNQKLSRHHQLEELSRGLKVLAKTLGITILTLSQLNREVEKRTSGRPIMADLKESGAIEEDADVVMLMWRHQQNDGSTTVGLEMPKNRQGRTGEMALHFEGSVQRWNESMASLAQQPKRSSGGDL